MSRRFECSRSLKDFKASRFGLPGGPEEDVVAAVATPVADVHATLADAERGVVAILERFGTSAEVPFQEVFASDTEMRSQRDRADDRRQFLQRCVEARKEVDVRVVRHPVAVRQQDLYVVVAGGSLPGFPLFGEIVGDLAGHHQFSQRPAAIPHHNFARSSFGCIHCAVAG